MLPLWLFALVVVTPAVFLLPLSLVTTAVFDETVLPFRFDGMFLFVSTTPSRAGLPLVAAPFELALFMLAFVALPLSLVPQAASAHAAASTNGRANLRCIP